MSIAVIDRHHEVRPDVARIVALSAAITLNATMLLLALRPLMPRMLVQPERTEVPITFIDAKPLPPPAPPKPIQMPHRVPPHPAPPVHHIRMPQPHVRPTPMSVPSPPETPPVPSAPVDGTPVATTTPPGPVQAQLAYLRAPLPRYPTAARRARMQGTVVLRVRIDMQGRPREVLIEQSSGYPLLDRAARLQVLRKWLFQPARVDGRITPAWALVPVNFNLRMP